MSVRRIGLAWAACALAAAAGTSACSSGGETSPATEPLAVILGDSITDWTSEYVEDRLAECAGIPTRIHALAARRIAEPAEYEGPVNSGIDEMARLAAAGVDPTHWVIELGANDVASLTSVADARALIDALLARTDPDDRVTWLTVYMTITPEQVAMFNSALAEASADTGLTIADWNARATGQPWLTDWVHLNNAGAEQLAQLYCEVLAT